MFFFTNGIVGGGLYAKWASGQTEIDLIGGVFLAIFLCFGHCRITLLGKTHFIGIVLSTEFLGCRNNAVDGGRFMVFSENGDWNCRAIGIQQTRIGFKALCGLPQSIRIAWQYFPAQRTIIPTSIHLLSGHWQGDDLFNPFYIGHMPSVAVDGLHRLVAGGAG